MTLLLSWYGYNGVATDKSSARFDYVLPLLWYSAAVLFRDIRSLVNGTFVIFAALGYSI